MAPPQYIALCYTYIDQVEGEGWVDKNAALRGWAFFTSYVSKL